MCKMTTMGIEPTIFRFEVGRLIHWATRPMVHSKHLAIKYSNLENITSPWHQKYLVSCMSIFSLNLAFLHVTRSKYNSWCHTKFDLSEPPEKWAAMAEWLRRLTRNQMGSSRVGSNPTRSGTFFLWKQLWTENILQLKSWQKMITMGFEPTIFWFVVRRLIRWATRPLLLG